MNNLKWKYSYNKISVEKVKTIIGNLNFAVPQDYAECVAINNGGHVRPYLFEVDGEEKVFDHCFLSRKMTLSLF